MYHLLGQYGYQEDLVLAQQDVTTFKKNISQRGNSIFSKVRAALATHTLLFIGFHDLDWEFETGNWIITLQKAVDPPNERFFMQINPARGGCSDPEQKHQEIEQSLGKGRLSIYWGTAEAF